MINRDFPYPRRHLIRFLLRQAANLAFAGLTRLHIVGREHLPDSGPLLVVANHFHFADPAVVMRVLPWQIEFLGGFHMPNAPAVVTWLPKVWGYYPVHRGGVSRDAMRAGMAVLAQNGVLGIFPEAGSWAAVLRPARPGAAFLAVETGVPLLPIGITGMNDIFPSLAKGRRATVTVRIGPRFGPFHVSGKGPEKRQALESIGHEIMQHIAALIPPRQHGCYSTDPEIRAAAQAAAVYPWEEKGK
ncbi:MAG: lysophospholipid acyltransferase family protein [Anaerolineae bacterium]|nr:lysophospholipid acyltransferase family protein [Anaerolineae bacterium]